jgi:hypothetical protein
MADWQSDWGAFIRDVASYFDRGSSDVEVSQVFGGRPVCWVGKVSEKQLDDELPSVTMDMPPIDVKLSDGRFTTADYLFLRVSNTEVNAWRSVPGGSTVRFTAMIGIGKGPFPAISWAKLSSQKGFIAIEANQAASLQSIGGCS